MNHRELNINDVIKGRDEAWRDVYTIFWQKLVYYIMRKNGGKMCKDDAEEIVQEAMLKIYRHRRIIESTGHLNNLLYKSVSQVSVDKFRKEKKGKFEHVEISDDAYYLIGENPLDENLDLDRVVAEVMAYIASLHPKYMAIVKQKIEEYGTRQPEHSNKFYIDLHRLRVKLNRKFNIS